MMDIARELQEIIEMKEGSKELAIFYVPGTSREWNLLLGNTSEHVMLGEVVGEIDVVGDSIEDVILKAKRSLSNQ